MFKTPRFGALAGAVAMVLMAQSSLAQEQIAMGSGAEGGPYYKLGQIICEVLSRKTENVDCAVVPMPAGDAADSFSNIVNVRDGAADIGLARSDWQYYAVSGTGPVQFMHTDFNTLRSLFSIDTRPFTLIASRDAEITSLDDLEGKRMSIGVPHSDLRKSIDLVMAAKGWSDADFTVLEELPPAEQSLALCHGWVQAIAYLASHPNSDVERVTKLCDAELVDVAGPAIDQLLEDTPYLAKMTIPGGVYLGNEEPVETIGTTITVVSSSDVPEDTIYAVVEGVFQNLDTLRRIDPTLRLEPAQMRQDGLTAPLHDGAARYYAEHGMM